MIMTNLTTTRSSTTSLRSDLEIIEVRPGKRFSVGVLQDLLPDIETLLFFAKVYDLDAGQLGYLLSRVHNTPLVQALTSGDHSTDLQDYVLDVCDQVDPVSKGRCTFKPDVPKGELLPELWKSLEVEVAQSIKDVAAKLESVVGLMPGKQGSMVFNAMMKLNAKRPILGDYRARIHHAPVKENLLILDVSGSMNQSTVKAIVNDVVALSYTANAHMAVVSNTTTHWAPGSYNVDDVLAAAEYGGTRYETLAPLFKQDWGVVVTVADYDSSAAALSKFMSVATGHVDQVIDVSLVNQPTFMAEVVGQIADRVRPILVGNSQRILH